MEPLSSSCRFLIAMVVAAICVLLAWRESPLLISAFFTLHYLTIGHRGRVSARPQAGDRPTASSPDDA